MHRPLLLTAVFALTVFAQKTPQFEDFPAPADFKGKPAAPKVERASDRMFRTKIRDGASAGPNFAGKFTIVQWGCGAGCVQTVVVDAASGAIYHLPSAELPCEAGNDATCPLSVSCQTGEPFAFRKNSQLLVVHACAKDGKPADIYLHWIGTKFARLK